MIQRSAVTSGMGGTLEGQIELDRVARSGQTATKENPESCLKNVRLMGTVMTATANSAI